MDGISKEFRMKEDSIAKPNTYLGAMVTVATEVSTHLLSS